jgi:hypothetical protein
MTFGYAKAAPFQSPSFMWNTFLGGLGLDLGQEIVVDQSGYIYVVGTNVGYCIDDCSTFTNPTWGNPLNPYGGGESDGFIAKLHPNGSLIWNTFLGGSGNDGINDLVIDNNGVIYLLGSSNSSWGNPVQPFSGGFDTFIVKLDSSGNLLWHTFIDHGSQIDLDNQGDIIVSGSSLNDWSIPNTPINSHSGGYDSFVLKLSPSGDYIWHTFLGGSAEDGVNEMIVSNEGNIHIVGLSKATWGSPIRAYMGTFWNAFVAEVDSSGTLLWNTFLGTGRDWGEGIDVDDFGNVYVVGTSSSTWGTPIRAFESILSFPLNGYAAKLDTNGALVWNTFLGMGSSESYEVDLDNNGYIYIAGGEYGCSPWGNPFNSPTVCSEGSIIKLNNAGHLITNGFIGGENSDYAVNLFVQDAQNIFVIGKSEGTWGTPIRAFQGDYDPFGSNVASSVFVVKINLTTPNNTPHVLSITRANPNPTNASSIVFNVTFSGTVTGVDISDFSLSTSGVSGASISEVNGSGNVYNVTVSTGSGDGKIRLDVIDNDSIVDVSSTPLGGLGATNGNFVAGEVYTIDKTPPNVVSITRAGTNPSNMLNVSYTVTFSESVIGVDNADFILSTSGVAGAFVSNVSGGGNTRIVSVSTGQGSGTIQLNFVDNNSVTDLATNPTTSGLSGETYTINKPQLKAPVLRSPRSGGTMNNTTPNFIWQSVVGAASYEIQIDDNNDFSSPEDSNNAVTGTNYTSIVLPEGTYYWRVRANDVSANPGQWSLVRTITIDTTGPAAPTLISPVDGFNSPNRTTTFRWQPSSGAVMYQFAYDNDANCLSPISTVTLRGTSRRATLPSGTYYWCVRAKDSLGNWGDWSAPYQINIP